MVRGKDLSDILAEGTGAATSTLSDFAPEAAEVKPEEAVNDFPDDFEEQAPEPELPVNAAPELEAETPDIPLTRDQLQKSAIRWIRFFNSAQKPVLRKAYAKRMLEPGDMDQVKRYNKMASLQSKQAVHDAVSSDDPLYHALERWERYARQVDQIEFQPDEIDAIAEPLAEVLEKYQRMQMSPEAALLMAVAMVMLPRIEPLFPGAFNIFK